MYNKNKLSANAGQILNKGFLIKLRFFTVKYTDNPYFCIIFSEISLPYLKSNIPF